MAMKLSQLVYKSMRKNIRHYFLYFFALIFSVTLYVSFITIQYNPSVLSQTEDSGTATAGFQAASYLLYFIILFFVLYANHLFMKRRSKEIGLYQLIGMTKRLIIRLVALENIVLFIGAVASGIGLGFLLSRFFTMILLNVLEQDVVAQMTFSVEALQQTVTVFAILLVIIVLQTVILVKRMTLLSLFQANAAAEERVKPLSWLQMTIGALGLVAIGLGYYLSSTLFSAQQFSGLLFLMVAILALTIGGTFLVFRFSVSFMMNVLRLRKKGHLRLVDVVAFTPIMHRMKGNAKSLTLITVLTAVSLAITTLSYITYYSIDAQIKQSMPSDIVTYNEDGEMFIERLQQEGIDFTSVTIETKTATIALEQIIDKNVLNLPFENGMSSMAVVKLSDAQKLYDDYSLQAGEAYITNYANFLAELMPLKEQSSTILHVNDDMYNITLKAVQQHTLLATPLSDGGPVLVVTDELYEKITPAVEGDAGYNELTTEHLIFIDDETQLEQATALYDELELRHLRYNIANLDGDVVENYFIQNTFAEQRKASILMSGVTIFTTAFLGLAFLVTTGSILYFKQMSEADEEKPAYTTLRKVGFSEDEIIRSMYVKQAFNFGVPLLIGLLHSYFAVKSGWFLFGSELVMPLVITMTLYVVLYGMFMLLSIQYYKRVIRSAL